MSEINVLTGAPISTGELGQIATMGARVLALETEIKDMEDQLSQRQEQLKVLVETTLPEAMLAVGLAEFKLTNGRRMFVDKYYSCGLPAKDDVNRSKAFDWLRAQGHEGLIKTKVTAEFGKGQDDDAGLAVMLLLSAGLPVFRAEDVHPMTLKSFVKEQYETGHSVPIDLFRVFIGNRIKIK